MKNFKSTFIGFLLFFFVTLINISLGVVIYSFIEELEKWLIALIILIIMILFAIIYTVMDHFRRKSMIEKPLNDILKATEQMTKGNFNIYLSPNHSYQDYDEFDKIKADLLKMANALSKSEMLKNDFISNVSHEIKTPLAVIQNYAKALNSQSLDKETQKKYLDNLQKACSKLSILVTNILKLNKLENQNLVPEFTRFNLSDLLISQILQFEDLIEKKNISLECEIEEKLFIISESSYLEIIFNNLISNAIKFTNNDGKIFISLKKLNENYFITFKDNGCGMTKETGNHIFDKFYQGDTSHSKEGNGLGLTLVKKVIDVLGGSISVESEINVGTTFIITIKSKEISEVN